MTSKIDHVTRLMAIAEGCFLSMPPSMARASILDIATTYNGIGPSWAPQWLRDALTGWLSLFQPAALIHDYHYSLIDPKTDWAEDEREIADWEFYQNCRKLTAIEYPIWNVTCWPLRAAHEYQAFCAWRAVRRLGGFSIGGDR